MFWIGDLKDSWSFSFYCQAIRVGVCKKPGLQVRGRSWVEGTTGGANEKTLIDKYHARGARSSLSSGVRGAWNSWAERSSSASQKPYPRSRGGFEQFNCRDLVSNPKYPAFISKAKASTAVSNVEEIRSQVGEVAAEVEKLENLVAIQRAQWVS